MNEYKDNLRFLFRKMAEGYLQYVDIISWTSVEHHHVNPLKLSRPNW